MLQGKSQAEKWHKRRDTERLFVGISARNGNIYPKHCIRKNIRRDCGSSERKIRKRDDHREESESLQEKSRDHYRSEHTLPERA